MPRDVSGDYTLPDGTTASPGETIASAKWNAAFEDIEEALDESAGRTPQFLLLAVSAALPNERVLTAGTNISLTDAGAGGALTVALSATLLNAIQALGSNGLVARTAAGTAAARTLTAPAAGITITNGDGVSGNPTLVLADDLAGLEGLSTNGTPQRTGAGTWAIRATAIDSNEDLSGARNASLTGFINVAEIASPANPAADNLRLFAKDVSSATHLFTRDSSGTEVDLTLGGGTASAATQAQEEAASSTTVFTSPGRQHFHPGMPKAWAYVTQAAGVYALQAGSYNVTSITKNATGDIRINLTNAVTSLNSCVQVTGDIATVIYSGFMHSTSVIRVAIRDLASAAADGGFSVTMWGDM